MASSCHGVQRRATFSSLVRYTAGAAVLLSMGATPVPATPTHGTASQAAICPAGAPKLSSQVASTPQGIALMLAGQIGAEVRRQPTAASTDDLEAAIVFAISQSGASTEAALSAVNSLSACTYDRQNFKAALDRVRSTLSRRGFKRGTSALAGGAGGSFSEFSLNIGGGTSNYSR